MSNRNALLRSRSPTLKEKRPRRDQKDPCITVKGRNEARFCDLCKHTSSGCIRASGGKVDHHPKTMEIIENASNTNSCSCFHNNRYSNCGFVTVCCVNIPAVSEFNSSHVVSRVFGNPQGRREQEKSELMSKLRSLASLKESATAVNGALDSLVDALEVLVDVAAANRIDLASKINRSKQLIRRLVIQRRNMKGQEELNSLRSHFYSSQKTRKFDRVDETLDTRRNNFSASDFVGLRCRTNRTVNFYYLDYEMHRNMLRSLGVESRFMQHGSNHPVMAIVDVKVSFQQM